jgi:hypothetical protein
MEDRPVVREPDQSAAWTNGVASALIPGLGQVAQRRYGTALLHFCSVTAYAAAALYGGHLWSGGALLFNVWSVIDAAWWARSSGADTAPEARESAITSPD